MHWVRVRVHQRNGDRLHARIRQRLETAFYLGFVEWLELIANEVDTSADLETTTTRDERHGLPVADIKCPLAIARPYLEHITESTRGQQADGSSSALHQNVRDQGRPMQDARDCADLNPQSGRRPWDRIHTAHRTVEELLHGKGIGVFVPDDAVGERPSDIRGQIQRHQPVLSSRSAVRFELRNDSTTTNVSSMSASVWAAVTNPRLTYRR